MQLTMKKKNKDNTLVKENIYIKFLCSVYVEYI